MPQLGATFVPSGFDDYYMPEVVAPAPQRITPQVPQNMQDDLQRMELEAREAPRPANDDNSPSSLYSNHPQRQSSLRGPPANAYGKTTDDDYTALPSSTPGKTATMSHTGDAPSFSPFPKVKGENIPPSDEDKEGILWKAREHVLHSNNVSMQLSWARDTLSWVEILQEAAVREADGQPRPQTPKVEHTLRLDAVSIVDYLAGQDHPEAMFIKAKWHEFGKFGVRQDKKEAYNGYKRAAALGYGRAEYRMGMLFESSNDFVQAVEHYYVGLRHKDSAASYRLGMMSLLGQHGQPKDYNRGLQLINEAADAADEDAPQGAYVYGMLLSRELPEISIPDTVLPLDLSLAKMYLEKAAYLGFAKAQLKMGQAYELCQLGCDFKPAYSIHYYGLAAQQGQPEASLGVSRWFLFGYEGVFNKNEQLAYKYAHDAAVAKLPTGEFAMGYYHEIGIHVSKDLRQARHWYELAAEHGNKDAVGRLDSLSESKALTKQDHETTTLTRIKSTHGSQRGKRPDRFRQQQQQPSKAMPTVTESAPTTPIDRPSPRVSPQPSPGQHPTLVQDGLDFPDPSRASVQVARTPAFGVNLDTGLAMRPKSAAPYPEDDRPAPLSYGGRSPSTAPYPDDDMASRHLSAGNLRSASGPHADRPMSAFGIRPSATDVSGGRHPYGNEGIRGSQSMANLAPTGGDPRGRPAQGPGGYRQPSPGPPGGGYRQPSPGPPGGGYRQPSPGPGGYGRQDMQRPSTAQPYGGGSGGGPASNPAVNKLSKQQAPAGYNNKPQPQSPYGGGGGYGAGPGPAPGAPNNYSQPNLSSQPQPGREYGARTSSRPTSTAVGPGGRPERYDSMPVGSPASAPRVSTGPSAGGRPPVGRPDLEGRTGSAPPGAQPRPPAPAQAKPGKQPGQGPATFEEMGIPQGKGDDQCVSREITARYGKPC
ncbi:hypothetical protein ACHAQF_001745 [Verticillium nonalfalfae]